MALSQLEANTIARAIATCNVLLSQVKPVLDSLNTLYNATGGVKTTITQANLDAAANLSGLTVQQVSDALFALTGALLTDVQTSYTQLAQLAARG